MSRTAQLSVISEHDPLQREVDARPRVALVVPMYNEADSVEKVIAEIAGIRGTFAREWEILPFYVDDGSQDETLEILRARIGAGEGRVIPLSVNLGIGGAVQAGFQAAIEWGADVVIQIDGDGQHPVGSVPELVRPVIAGTADVVVGSRYVSGAGGNVSSRAREWGTWYFSVLLKMLTGLSVRDVTSGYRAFSREAARVVARSYADDYPEVELYAPLARGEFRVIETPVRMRERTGGVSSINAPRALYYMVKVTLATLLHFLRPKPPRRRGSGK